MPILAGDIVMDVARALVENPPYITFPSGLFTQKEILTYIDEVQLDFLTKVMPVHRAVPVTWQPDVRIYTQPDNCLQLDRIENGGVSLRNTSQANLDLYVPGWVYEDPTPTPASWFQDQLAVNQYGIRPAPEPFTTAILAATNASPIQITTQDPHGLSTGEECSNTGCTGNDAANGVFVASVISPTILTLNGSAGDGAYTGGGVLAVPSNLWFSEKIAADSAMGTPLLVPFVFTPYVKYGTLARAWAKDGEQRNPTNAKYCRLRYDFGVMLAKRFMAWSKTDAGLNSESTALRNVPVPAVVERS